MKRWSCRKVTPEMKSKMRDLREEGWTFQRIANHFGVALSTAQYHCNDRYKRQTIQRVKRSPTYPKKRPYSDPNYIGKYVTNRYRKDEEFRERMKKHIRKYDRKIWVLTKKRMEVDSEFREDLLAYWRGELSYEQMKEKYQEFRTIRVFSAHFTI